MGYLQESFAEFKKKYPTVREIGILRDMKGMYAYNIIGPSGQQYFFCAKASLNGNQVSCHEELLLQAYRGKIPLIMWVKGEAYKIFAADVYAGEHVLNIRDGVRMVNFPLWKVGQKIGETKPAPVQPGLFT